MTYAELLITAIINILKSNMTNPQNAGDTIYFLGYIGAPPNEVQPIKGIKPLVKVAIIGDDAIEDLNTEQGQKGYSGEISCIIRTPPKVNFSKQGDNVIILKPGFWVLNCINQINNILRINEDTGLKAVTFETEKLEKITFSNADYIPKNIGDALYSEGSILFSAITTQVKPEKR